jgi:hypothetical protein
MKYIFRKSNDGWSCGTTIYDSERILESVFNHRIEDAQSWSEIIEDIEFIMSMPNEYVYNADGSIYEGKYMIEQRGIGGYAMIADYSTSNVVTPNCAYSNKDYTEILQDRKDNKNLQVRLPTSQMLILIKKWRDFLLSEKTEEEGEVEIDFLEVVYYDRKNVE